MKDAFTGFSDHKVTKLSASLAYYTVFSLGPLLVVIIALAGIFFGQEAVQGDIYNQLKSFIGADAAGQIQTIIKNASISGKGGMAATIGVITLLIGASTVFGELQDSMNSIWGVKAKPKAGMMKLITSRLLSFGMIATLGFLLLVSLAVTSVVEGLGDRLKAMFADVTVILLYIVNLILTVGVVTVLFAVIFKVLPDVKLKWKDIWLGAAFTAFLFLVGKFGISLYISKSNVGSTYGSAGSLVVLLLWVYYSSIIVYFGAEFTRAYALRKGAQVQPAKMAEWDDKPAIAGAKPASESIPGAERKRERAMQPPPPKLIPAHIERHPGNPGELNTDRKAGIGTAILGLALYLFTRNR